MPVMFLDETWAFASGRESKIWNYGTRPSAKKRRRWPTLSTRYIIVHAGTQNEVDLFLGQV